MNFDNNQKSLAIISGADFNPNCISEFGGFPLCVAASRGNLKLAKELLKKGANPNLRQREKYHQGETPLFDASFIYSQELDPVLEINPKKKINNYKIKDQIVKVLLDYGADEKKNYFKNRNSSLKIPVITNFVDENGVDRMKEMIKENYDRIKAEAKQIVVEELQRIKDDPELCHLLQQQRE